MVQFGVPSVEAAMILGREAADYISGTFIKVRVCGVIMTFFFGCWYTAKCFARGSLFAYIFLFEYNI